MKQYEPCAMYEVEMKLLSLKALRYRSLRDIRIPMADLNLFIGANASGKSTILDALRFLHESVHDRDFKSAFLARGGAWNVAWKGEDPGEILKARDRVQILVTTHSPLLLDFLNAPEAVCVVRHTEQEGTRVTRESNPEAIRKALEASGFGLGEYYETKGFGG